MNRLVLRTAAALAGVFALGLALAAVAGAGWSPWATARLIAQNATWPASSDPQQWQYPDIDGNYVVWQRKSVSAANTEWDIYLYDRRSRTQTAITTVAGNQTNPRVSGDWVVWTDAAGSTGPDVWAYRISTKTKKPITSRAGTQDRPDISGTKVVYMDGNSVRLHDLATGKDVAVDFGVGTKNSPAISGDRIAISMDNDVYLKDMRTGSVKRLTTDGDVLTHNRSPRIDGLYLSFVKQPNGPEGQVYLYDISSSTTTRVTTTRWNGMADVYDTKLVWHSQAMASLEVRAFDIIRKKTAVLTPDDLGYGTPTIFGNDVVATQGGGSAVAWLRLAAPTLSITTPNTVGYNTGPAVKGVLLENGTALAGKGIDVLGSNDGGHTWAKLGSATTDANGSFSYTAPAIVRATSYRARFNGDTKRVGLTSYEFDRFSALSGVRLVKPKAYLTRPSFGTTTLTYGKTYKARGYLKPRHTAGTYPVKIKAYRKSSTGKWVYKKTYSAKAFDYSSYTNYVKSIKLPSRGKWRLRAVHPADSLNATTYSGWRYVTVK